MERPGGEAEERLEINLILQNGALGVVALPFLSHGRETVDGSTYWA